MVSDQEIAKGVETLLRQSDPNSITTFNGVVQQLQANLGLDLSDKTLFIRDQINLLLRQPVAHPLPQPQPQPQPQSVPVKDHFPVQNQPYFQNPHPQFHPHFALQPQHHHHQQLLLLQQQKQQQQQQQQQHHHQPQPPQQRTQELDFRVPQPQAKAPPAVALKHEVAANVQNVASNSLESPKESASAAPKRKGGPGGLNKVCGISPELQAVLGEPALPRTEIVKQLWAYIRKHNLQDPSNKRKIICDDALRVVFETDSTDMFKMNKLLSKHIIRLEPNKESKRTKVKAEAATGNSESAPPPVTISEALSNFLGTGDREMQQSEVLGRVWEYIKVNHLEDPQHPVVIICDEKLKELLGCESISMMGISEILTRQHILKR